MAQGKTKVKSKLPDGVKQKKSTGKNHYTRKKGAPMKAKKTKFEEANKIRAAITKNVNKKNEEEMRLRSTKASQINLSKAQEAVIKHHEKLSEKIK